MGGWGWGGVGALWTALHLFKLQHLMFAHVEILSWAVEIEYVVMSYLFIFKKYLGLLYLYRFVFIITSDCYNWFVGMGFRNLF